MTTFTAPPNQNGLTLNAGDTLQVNQGGVATGTIVNTGGHLNIFSGGTAVNTVLDGGAEVIRSGSIQSGIAFQSTFGGSDFLDVEDPGSLHDTLTFGRNPDSNVPSYSVKISFGGHGGVTGVQDMSDAFKVNFEDRFSVTYSYKLEAGALLNFQPDVKDGFILINVTLNPPSLAFSHETAATIVYTAEFGIAPSATELNLLTQFTQAQFAYGQQIGVDAGIYTFTALGVALAAGQHFQDEFGSANSAYPNSTAGDAKFVTDAYVNVFGHAGSAAQVQHFVDQLNYYEGIYTAAGTLGDASNIDLLARGAVYGQMLGVEHGEGLGATPGPVFDLTEGQDTIALDQSGSAVNGTLGGADATWTPGDTITAAPGTTDESFDIQGIGPAGVIDVTSVPGNRVVGVQNVNISANTAASGFADQAIKGDFTGTGPEGEWTGLKSLTVISAGNEAGADNLTVGPETAVQITDTLTSATSEVLTVNGSSTTSITENNLAANAGIAVNGGSGTTAVSIIQTESTPGLDGLVNIFDVNGESKTQAGTITDVTLDGLSELPVGGGSSIIDNALTNLAINNSDPASHPFLALINNLTTPTATTLNLSLSHNGIDAAGTATNELTIADLSNSYSTLHLSLGAQNSSVTLDFEGLTTLDTPDAGTGALAAGSLILSVVDTAVNFNFSGLNGPNNIFVDRGSTNNADVYTLGNFGTDNGFFVGANKVTDQFQFLEIDDDIADNADTINFGSGAYIIDVAPHQNFVQTAANGAGLANLNTAAQWAIINNDHGGSNVDTLLFKTDNAQTFSNISVNTIAEGIALALSVPAHTVTAFLFGGNTFIFDHADDSFALTPADAMVELVGNHPIAAISATHVLTFLT